MIARRLTLTLAVSLCSLVGALSLSVPAALAVAPPVVEEEAVLDVAATSATLQAKINPEGSETTYRFEYGTSEAYGSSIPVPDGLVGSGLTGEMVSEHPQDLLPRTEYHYRVVALVSSRGETVPGSDGIFTTQSSGNEFALPDGRQWELVSPPNKHGAPIPPVEEAGLIQAAEDGGAMTYLALGPTELEPQGDAAGVQVFSQRGAQGWSSKDISTPHSHPTGAEVGAGWEYRSFSPDLSLALVDPQGPFTPLSSEATERTPYIRHDFSCEVTPATCYMPLVTTADVAPGVKFGNESGPVDSENASGEAQFVDVTPDFSHVLIKTSEIGLTTTPGDDDGGLYEWGEGKLQLVSILPESEGGNPAGAAEPGYKEVDARHAISNDGSRVFWGPAEGTPGLYMRDTAKEETVHIGSVGAIFQTASSDGSRVFYSTNEQGALETCDLIEVAEKLNCDPTLLAPNIQGAVLGASEDGSYVYFVSDSVLSAGAVPGTCEGYETSEDPGDACNLYVAHNNGSEWEAPKLIAVLSAEDAPDWDPNGGESLAQLTARVSPDGRWVAFMSQRDLTGYDTRDAVSGQPDEEVYLYNAESGKLACASCDPTGARPTGTMVEISQNPLFQGFHVWDEGIWLAANIPGWDPYRGAQALYQSRYLSDSGRLFFNSKNALVSQDINGTWDVYEFEPAGIGSCSSTSVTFSEKSGGCVSLISSGSSPEESVFMDASETGDDVFLLTASRLQAEDVDTEFDIYDARVCSASMPCFSHAVSLPPCNSGDSCKAAPSPQPEIFGAPSSATFVGTGNVVVSSAKPGVRSRPLARSQKLARALRACRKKPKGKRRVSCERTARKSYGVRRTGNAKAMSKGER